MRLLVATEFGLDAPGGGPAVVRQMLRGFPGDICWWSVNGRNHGPLTHEGVRAIGGAAFPAGKLIPAQKITHLKSWAMEHVWALAAEQSLRHQIACWQPDKIWVIPHNWSIFPLRRTLIRGTAAEIPYHATVQDYPDAHFHGKLWGWERAERMARMQEDIYRLATTRDATSYPMLDDLALRTGKNGVQMLHQGLEDSDIKFLENRGLCEGSARIDPVGSPVRIAYAGTILVMREFALFTQALERVRRMIPVELHLWGAHSYQNQPWFRGEWMIEHGNLSERDLIAALRECDWGFIPMSLRDEDPRYNRFSFPTKFITYLAAGLPVITLANRDSSVMRMAETYDVGLRFSEEPIASEDLMAGLTRGKKRDVLDREILKCARNEFQADDMREMLWRCFLQ